MTKYYNLTKALVKTMFNKDSPIILDNAFPIDSPPGVALTKMRTLVSDGQINEAENLVFDYLDKRMPVFAAIGLEFYARISELEEKELKAADFSVEEIGDGIRDLLKFYNIKLMPKGAKDAPQMKVLPRQGMSVYGIPKMSVKQGENTAAEPSLAPNVLADKPKGN